jgi:DNA replication protein DnaC
VTSNLEFGRWSEIFGDHRLTAALVDRLVHHSHILVFSGKSYRLRQAMEIKRNDTNPSTRPIN